MTLPPSALPPPALPPLARNTIDRAAFRRTDDAWLAAAWTRGRLVVLDLAAGGRTLVTEDPSGGVRLVLLTADQADTALSPALSPTVSPAGERWFLGVDEGDVPLWATNAPLPELPGTRAAGLRDVGHLLDDRDAGLFTQALALAQWHASHLFSPRSGLPTEVIEAGWARRDTEGRMMWPRTDPAMIVLVHDGVAGPDGRCLLGHNAGWSASEEQVRRFSCLAGFVEPGESAEAAVAREVSEEVGVRLTTMAYAGSQSWPFPGSLMLGFHATADPDQTLTLDPAEIDEARWFPRDVIAKMLTGDHVDPATGVRLTLPMAASIAHFLIEDWLHGFPR